MSKETNEMADFKSLLPQLTLSEKVTLLSGRDFSNAAGISRLNIPPIKVSNSFKSSLVQSP